MNKKTETEEDILKKIKPLSLEKKRRISQWGHPCYWGAPFEKIKTIKNLNAN